MALSFALRQRLAANRPALGGAPLGNLYRAIDDAQARAVVAAAWNAGVRYFDTAPHYGHGRSEHRLGAALAGYARDDYVLSTKVGRLLREDASAPRNAHGYVDALPYVQHYDYTGAGFRRSLAESLERLGSTRVDLVYVHDIDRTTHGAAFDERLRDVLDDGLPALAALKRDGVIAGYGLGVNEVDICLEVLARTDVDVILLAGRYTLADQSALRDLLPECARRDVAIVLGGPFNSGILATGAAPADGSVPRFDYAAAPAATVARVQALETVCARFGVPLKAAALQFPRGHPAIACVLAGAATPTEVAQNAVLAAQAIPAAFWEALRHERLIAADAPCPA